ncbi:hypothetical protein [Modestobacter excelsi]|uniref:hypothetical protein n=1 Tax=Modestobacter excelsi TaxID=2213161 RepID=UPI001C20CDCB|nr:hypothetical protein [Modestobacter excelsi]
MDVLTDRDFRAGAGLASRAAERCAVRRALVALGQAEPLPQSDAELTARLGRPGTAMVVGTSPRNVSHVALDLAAWGLSMILLDTGARHLSSDGALPARRRVLDEAAARLGTSLQAATPEQLSEMAGGPDPVVSRCARHVITERSRVAAAVQVLTIGDVGALGELMTASHSSLSRDLRTTTRPVDRTVEAALTAGAVGVRMTGAGLGGSLLVLVPTNLEKEVLVAVNEAAAHGGFLTPRPTPLTLAGRSWVVS